VPSVIISFHELTGHFHEIHDNHRWPANSSTVRSTFFWCDFPLFPQPQIEAIPAFPSSN
jgi:hypothetical protein